MYRWCILELRFEISLLFGTKHDLNRFWCQLCHSCVAPPFCWTCCIIAIWELRLIRSSVSHEILFAKFRHLYQTMQVVRILERRQVWVIPVTGAFLLGGFTDHVWVLLAQKCLIILILALTVRWIVLPEWAVVAHDCSCVLLCELWWFQSSLELLFDIQFAPGRHLLILLVPVHIWYYFLCTVSIILDSHKFTSTN